MSKSTDTPELQMLVQLACGSIKNASGLRITTSRPEMKLMQGLKDVEHME